MIILTQNDVVMFADASLQKDKNMASVGTDAIDSFGNLLQAFGTPIQFVGKAITAEVLAIRVALENAKQNGWAKVHILSDTKNVVEMICKKLVVLWEIETTCEDIWMLVSLFEDVHIIHIPRSCNMLAHNLAKFYISLLDKVVWFSSFPNWIVNDATASF